MSHTASEPPACHPSALGSLYAVPQNIRMRIISLAIEGGAEIHVKEDLAYTVPRHALTLLQISRGLRDEVLRSDLITFVFSRPGALKCFLTGQSASSPQHSLLSPSQMTSVRLVILDALETDGVTEEEAGGIEGPHITPLFQGWADAARHLPSGVGIVDLDLRHSFPLRFHVTGRLVQRISTTIHIRSGRYTRFRISGCWTRSTKRYVENSTVAVLRDREDEDLEPGDRKRKCGPNGDYFYKKRAKGRRFEDVYDEPMSAQQAQVKDR